jgi:uncharacterized membrane protein YidH (DUF202 family)
MTELTALDVAFALIAFGVGLMAFVAVLAAVFTSVKIWRSGNDY